MNIICPHCGAANPDAANFCSRCGTDLRNDAGVRPPAGSETGSDLPESAPPAQEPGTQRPAAAAPGAPADQPWLRPDFLGEDDAPFEPEEPALGAAVDDGVTDATDIPIAAGRLVSGVQGLLEPIRVATMPGETVVEPAAAAPVAAGTMLSMERLRRVRALMGEEPLLASVRRPVARRSSLWLPGVFLLIAIAIGAPLLGAGTRTTGSARVWPGVNAAFTAVNQLPPAARVQILWAYDPATAGEMDLVAAPVIRHLLEREAQPEIVSLLPAGPAPARRLISSVQRQRQRLGGGIGSVGLTDVAFLPGGVMVLPALAQEPAALALVFGAETEDVQGWLEQVAPRNGVPVVAVTAAGADPALRPYLDSGQLVGLVSGFDGAASYTALLDQRDSVAQDERMTLQLAAQNLAILTIVLLIVAGNLAVLFGGKDAPMADFLAQNDWVTLVGAWIGFVVALLVFSAILGDHWFARLGQYVLVGSALGYAAVITWHQLWQLPFVTQLRTDPIGPWWNWIPVALAVMLALATMERIFRQGEMGPPRGGIQRVARWLGLLPAALLVGAGVAIILFGMVQGTLLPQFLRAAHTGLRWDLPPEVFLTGLLSLVMTASTLVFYAVDPDRHLHDQPGLVQRFMRGWIWVGQQAVWLAAGVVFPRLIVSRTSLLLAQYESFRLVLAGTGLWQAIEAWWRSLTGM